jgi:hypothetical protein
LFLSSSSNTKAKPLSNTSISIYHFQNHCNKTFKTQLTNIERENMERLQDLIALTFFLYYKTFTIKSRKFTLNMIGFASKKGKIFAESLWNIIPKKKNKDKLVAPRDRTLFIHAYEFSCSSTPQSSQPLRSRIRSSYKLLPCLSTKTLDVESNSVILLPREMMHHSKAYCNNSGAVLAIEGPQKYSNSVEQESSSPYFKCEWVPPEVKRANALSSNALSSNGC